MNKFASLLIVVGSGLAAFGFAGWQANGHPMFTLTEATAADWSFSAGWPLHSQLEITFGIALLAGGAMLPKPK